jgi:hypothetical protein
MDSYDFATVSGPYVGIAITDPSELEFLTSRIKESFPGMRVSQDYVRKLPTGEVYSTRIDKLSNRDYDVLWWVIKELCHRGWEPLGAASLVYSEGSKTELVYQFGRRVPAGEVKESARK